LASCIPPRPPTSTLLPYTTLFRSVEECAPVVRGQAHQAREGERLGTVELEREHLAPERPDLGRVAQGTRATTGLRQQEPPGGTAECEHASVLLRDGGAAGPFDPAGEHPQRVLAAGGGGIGRRGAGPEGEGVAHRTAVRSRPVPAVEEVFGRSGRWIMPHSVRPAYGTARRPSTVPTSDGRADASSTLRSPRPPGPLRAMSSVARSTGPAVRAPRRVAPP